MGKFGSGYLGSPQMMTSSANQELVPTPPSSYPFPSYCFYKMSFNNVNDCTVIINGKTTIFLPAGEGFESDANDLGITSFVIKEAGVNYTFVAGY